MDAIAAADELVIGHRPSLYRPARGRYILLRVAKPAVSVLLSIYDQPNAFTFALLGYQRQTWPDFELVICDDGSDAETKAIVERFRKESPFPVKHVWQENKGYRRSKIVNTGFRESEGGIVLLSDGDCIPHRDFVKMHATHGGAGRFCVGGYVRLSAETCQAMTEATVRAGEYEATFSKADQWRFFMTHIKGKVGVLFGNIKKPKVYGCNISCGRDVFTGVNGYDENFDGFGKEDSDLRNRFRRYGATPVSLWGKAWVYHVDDAIDPKIRQRRIPRKKNTEYYHRKDVPVKCLNGIEKPA